MKDIEGAVIIFVGIPTIIASVVGSSIGIYAVMNQVDQNGDTTLNLGSRRAKPCQQFEDVRDELAS